MTANSRAHHQIQKDNSSFGNMSNFGKRDNKTTAANSETQQPIWQDTGAKPETHQH